MGEGEGCYYSPWLRSVLSPLPWRPIEFEGKKEERILSQLSMLCEKAGPLMRLYRFGFGSHVRSHHDF